MQPLKGCAIKAESQVTLRTQMTMPGLKWHFLKALSDQVHSLHFSFNRIYKYFHLLYSANIRIYL